MSTVSETILKDEVLPLLQERRATVPVKRVLENDDIMTQQQLLLAFHMDIKVRIFFVEIVNCDIFEVLHSSDKPLVHPGFFEGRVREKDQDS